MPLQPVKIEKIGSELAVSWSDGRESFIPLERLRRGCPCASCCGEPDVMGNVDRPPETALGADGFNLVEWQIVGGYAIQPRWADGHRSGIYSYPYLISLALD